MSDDPRSDYDVPKPSEEEQEMEKAQEQAAEERKDERGYQ
jgi:hypothetical protein